MQDAIAAMRFVPFAVVSGAIAATSLAACTKEEWETLPDVVENRPGALVITTPARAAFIEADGEPVEVRGKGATAGLTVNGEPAEVEADGSFHSVIKARSGLNLVVAVDGDSRLETPFLYGHFAPPTTAVPQAVSIAIGASGVQAAPPDASLTSVANAALVGRDLVAMMKGKTFEGEAAGAAWRYEVGGGHHQAVTVDLAAAPKGVSVFATVDALVIEGTLTITAVGITTSRFTRLVVDRVTVSGDTELAMSDGVLGAAMPSAIAKLEGFRWDSGNFGFPCCVDSIASGYLAPKIEEAVRDGIREHVPSALKSTLDGIGLPKELDLATIGLTKAIPIAARFDGGNFDSAGAEMTASVRFGGVFPPGAPGANAPGWLELGLPMSTPKRPRSIGASFSVDAVNQLLFAAWGAGALTYTMAPPHALKLDAGMPPILSVAKDGAVRVAAGELLVQHASALSPMAAVTVIQDVAPVAEGDALVLAAIGEPTISVTWLADDNVGSGKNLVATAAKDQLARLLRPFRLPLPRMALDKLGAGFAGQSLGVRTLAIDVDAPSGRLAASGAMTIGH